MLTIVKINRQRTVTGKYLFCTLNPSKRFFPLNKLQSILRMGKQKEIFLKKILLLKNYYLALKVSYIIYVFKNDVDTDVDVRI